MAQARTLYAHVSLLPEPRRVSTAQLRCTTRDIRGETAEKPILTYSQQIYLTATTDPCHAVKRPRSDNNQADASSNRTNKPQNSHSGELIRGGKGPSAGRLMLIGQDRKATHQHSLCMLPTHRVEFFAKIGYRRS